MSYGGSGYLLTYESTTYNPGRKMRSGGAAQSSKFVTVMKLAKPAEALKTCEETLRSVASSANRTVSRLSGFDCGYVVAIDPPGDRSKWEYEEGGIARQYGFAVGPYFALWQDSAEPVSMMVASSSYSQLVGALNGEMLQSIVVSPSTTQDGGAKSSMRFEGNKVYVTDESGKERVVTLVGVSKEEPPTYTAPGASELGAALQRFLAPQLWGAIPPTITPGQRQDYVIAAPMPGEGIVDAMTAAGESVANWVMNNSAQRNLVVLAAGVSMALSHSTFAGAVDGASAPVGKQIICNIMVVGTAGFVKALGSDFLTNKSAAQRTGEAAAKAGGDVVASLPGNMLGGVTPAAMNFFRQGLSQTALTLASQGVNIATDAVVQKLGVSEKTADLLMKAPSFAADLMKPPSQPYESGGIQYNFDK